MLVMFLSGYQLRPRLWKCSIEHSILSDVDGCTIWSVHCSIRVVNNEYKGSSKITEKEGVVKGILKHYASETSVAAWTCTVDFPLQ
jgi:hypothetical protein